jgi:DNA recombination protein RmuC
MEIVLGIIIFVLVIAIIILAVRGRAKPDATSNLLKQDLTELSRNVNNLSEKMTENMRASNDSVHKQFAASAKLIADITEKLTKLDETNKGVLTATDKLEDLQNILLNPKHRGNFGEFQLNSVLENFFPPNQWEAQYKFKDGETVDAILRLADGKILPIDSKFSLENYQRMINEKNPTRKKEFAKMVKNDLKKRIDETAKYVRPAEGTMDFAFMFIPSEALYYDALVASVGDINSRDLIEYAYREKKVMIVSPTTFVAYLQTVLQGLRGMEITKQAEEIRKRVGKLGEHISKYDAYMNKLGTSLSATVGHFNTAHKELKKIDKDVVKIAGGDERIEETLSLDRPKGDDE